MTPRRFSHSLVSTYLDCPRKAYYRYVENVPSPKSSALMKGSACDSAWTYHLQQKMETKEDLPLADLLEVTESAFRDDVAGQGGIAEIEWGDSTPRASLDSALALTRTWHTQLAPLIEPTAVQVELHRSLPSGRDFIGYLDFEGTVDGREGVIGDNKTGSRRMSTSEAEKALQPSAYGFLRGKDTSFVFARAIDTGKSHAGELVWTERPLPAIAWYADLLNEVEAAFEAGSFPPNPTSNLCGKYCPFLERCMPHRFVSGPIGGREPEQPDVPA